MCSHMASNPHSIGDRYVRYMTYGVASGEVERANLATALAIGIECVRCYAADSFSAATDAPSVHHR